MTPFGDTGRRRLVLIGLLAAPLALAGWVGAGIAQGAGVPAPAMEVLPKTDLKYGQTVEIRAHHLPKGSGSVVATICGLQDTAGAAIANPTAGDCANASPSTTLAVEKAWQPDGEFDTKYALPASTRTFGSNARSCDHNHRCVLVVADANAAAPVYRLVTAIFFVDQPFVPSPATTIGKAGAIGRAPSGVVDAARAATGSSTDATLEAVAANDATGNNATTSATTTTTSTPTKSASASRTGRSRSLSIGGRAGGKGSTAPGSGGTGSSSNGNGAGSTGGTTSGTVSDSGSGPGTGGDSGSGSGPGPSAGPVTVPPVTVPPVTVPPVTVPPVTVPPTVPAPPPSDPVCADLSDIVQLVGGTPSPADCGLAGTPAAPVTGIVGPLLGRH